MRLYLAKSVPDRVPPFCYFLAMLLLISKLQTIKKMSESICETLLGFPTMKSYLEVMGGALSVLKVKQT